MFRWIVSRDVLVRGISISYTRKPVTQYIPGGGLTSVGEESGARPDRLVTDSGFALAASEFQGQESGDPGELARKARSVGPTKVCRAHDGNIQGAELVGGALGKEAEVRSCVRRQEFWLKRKVGDADHLAWRPAKRHRCSAKWWLYNLDSQLSVSLPFDGLRSFVRQTSSPEWSASEWRLWYDLRRPGQRRVSAVSYLKSLGCNLTCIPDWSHGGQNDFYDTLRELHLFSFWVLCMIMWNVEHGPGGDDLRWN